jgi:hypothetical protein
MQNCTMQNVSLYLQVKLAGRYKTEFGRLNGTLLANVCQVCYFSVLTTVSGTKIMASTSNNVKTYQFKHSVKDDQIIHQKLQISILLIRKMVWQVI